MPGPMRVTLLVSSDAAFALRLAAAWAAGGDAVTAVLLDQAAALARRRHTDGDLLMAAQRAGASVAVHDEALRRRGVTEPVPEGLKTFDLDEVADLVIDGSDKVLWW